MNLKYELSDKNQHLLADIGIEIKDKDYSAYEIKQCETSILTHIMNQSTKNGVLLKEADKYSDIMNLLFKYE